LEHEDAVTQAAFSMDGRLIVTSSLDHTCRLWDAGTGAPSIVPILHPDAVLSAAISPDGRIIATACDDGAARLWDAATGELVAPPLQHALSVRHVAFSGNGRLLLTASWDKTARIWDVSPCEWSPEEVGEFARIEAAGRLNSDEGIEAITGSEVAVMLKLFATKRPAVYTNPKSS
jgi:WD40 repeat protein